MPEWVIWLIIAVALGIAEVFTTTLTLAVLAVAALMAALVDAVGLPVGFQVAAFAVTAVAGLGAVRPIALRHTRQPPILRSGAAALVGREAIVVAEVSRTAGLVRIGGEEWTARPYDSSLTIPQGATVDVLAIEGATALVYPRED